MEEINLFNIESLSSYVSDRFAEELYNKMVSFIANFKARGLPETILHDVLNVTSRDVVDDEVWSLKIRMPVGNALTMTNICRQIIKDVKDNKFEEAKYLKLLDDF